MTMNTVLQQILREYPDAVTDRDRLELELLTRMPKDPLLRNTLLMAQDVSIPEDLAHMACIDRDTLDLYVQVLARDFGISEVLAELSIQTWREALGTALMSPENVSSADTPEPSADWEMPVVPAKSSVPETMPDSAYDKLFQFEKIPGGLRLASYIGFHDTELRIPSRVHGQWVIEIGERAFYRCDQLRSVSLSEGTQILGKDAFSGCSQMENLSLPNSLQNIESGCFQNTGLKTLVVPHGVERIGRFLCANCRKLESVVLPDAIEVIPYSAFDQCESLTHIRLPKNLQEIGEEAFKDCHALKEIRLPEGLKRIAEQAFLDAGLNVIHVPDSVERIESHAFPHPYIPSGYPGPVIYCHAGTYVQRYARENQILCEEEPS